MRSGRVRRHPVPVSPTSAVAQVLVMQVAQVIGYTRGRQVVDADLPAPASGGEGP